MAIDHIFVQYVMQEKLFVTSVRRRDIGREFAVLVPRLAMILNSYITLAALKYAEGNSLHNSFVGISVRGKTVYALIDSESTHSFIHPDLVQQHSMTVHATQENVTMATTAFSTKMVGYCLTDITLKGRQYSNVKLYIWPNLCADVILGQN